MIVSKELHVISNVLATHVKFKICSWFLRTKFKFVTVIPGALVTFFKYFYISLLALSFKISAYLPGKIFSLGPVVAMFCGFLNDYSLPSLCFSMNIYNFLLRIFSLPFLTLKLPIPMFQRNHSKDANLNWDGTLKSQSL